MAPNTLKNLVSVLKRRDKPDVLDKAGLVKIRREGRYRFHDLDTSPLLVRR